MPRKFGSTLTAIVITAIVVVWLASDPPQSRGRAMRERAQSEAPRAAPETLEPQARAAVGTVDEGLLSEADVPAVVTPRDWSSTCPPGVVEVLVLLDDEPLEGARVRLTRENSTHPALEMPTDALGLVRFGPLEGRIEALIEATTHDGASASTHAIHLEQEATQRTVIYFGRGGVEGTVYGANGLPLPDLRIDFSVYPTRAATGWSHLTQTALDGSYRIAGVPAGSASVHAGQLQLASRRRIDLDTADGQWTRADFGAPLPSVRWNGRLLLRSGAWVRGLGQLHLRRIENGEHLVVRCDENGQFSAELPPGEYEASVWTASDVVVVATAPVGQSGLARDLTVPGIELWGFVSLDIGQEPDRRVPRDLQVWVENVAAKRKHLAHALRDEEGYVLTGLDAGEYSITAHAQGLSLLGVGDEGLRIVLDEQHDQAQLDLTFTDQR